MKRNSFISIVSILLSTIITLSTVASAKVDNVCFFSDNNYNYLKFISGFGDGTIRPDEYLTRAQCAKMLTNIVNIEDNVSEKKFNDVFSSFWANDDIAALGGANILFGYKDGTFKPNQMLTRAEFVTIIARIADVKSGKFDFSDTASNWAKNDINALANAGYINGYPDKTFRPDALITRAEAVKVLNKVVKMNVNKNESREIFTDLPTTHWAYYEMMSAVSSTAFDSAIKHSKMSFNDISYIEIDVESIVKEFDAILGEFVTASVERQAEIFNKISTIESDVALAIAMSNINSQRDVTSEKDRKNIENSTRALNAITDAKEKRSKYLSVVKDPDKFEELIGMQIADVPEPDEAAPERLIELYVEEQEYENEFNSFMYEASIVHNGEKYSLSQGEYSSDPILKAKALNYYVDNRLVYGGIFSKLINVRTRIANFFGYRYYTDIGYMRAGKFYYTPEDVAVIRQDVKKYIAPLVYNIEKAARGHDNGYYNLNTPTVYDIPNKSALNIAREFLRQMSPQSRKAFDYLETYDLIDYQPRANKSTIAFTSYIGEYDMPFIFLNQTGTKEDIETLCHEFGHALQAYRLGGESFNTPDVAEIASYGMEMLSIHNYEHIFGKDSAAKESLMNFYYKLTMILISTFMDEFQYMVYKDTLLTIDERNELYAKLYKEYFIGANFNHAAYNKGIIWTNPTHIFTVPYYSIDYTLALTVAFQLWEIGEKEGFDKEFETYMEIIESPYVNTSAHSVAVYAGMDSPFKKGVIESFAKKIDEMYKAKYKEEQAP